MTPKTPSWATSSRLATLPLLLPQLHPGAPGMASGSSLTRQQPPLTTLKSAAKVTALSSFHDVFKVIRVEGQSKITATGSETRGPARRGDVNSSWQKTDLRLGPQAKNHS